MTPIAQLPGGELSAELSSPEGEAAAARLSRYAGSPTLPTSTKSTSPRSSPTIPPLPVYTSGNAYPGYQPYGGGWPPAQWHQPLPIPRGYSPMTEYFSLTCRSP